MALKRFTGLALILTSAIISLSHLVITGAVVGVQSSRFVSLVALLSFISGVLLLYISTPSGQANIWERYANHNKNAGVESIILDTTAVIKGKKNPRRFLRSLEQFTDQGGQIEMPHSVKEELDSFQGSHEYKRRLHQRDRFKMNVVCPNPALREDPRGSSTWNVIRSALEKSQKHQNFLVLAPYFQSKITPRMNLTDEEFTRLAPYMQSSKDGAVAFNDHKIHKTYRHALLKLTSEVQEKINKDKTRKDKRVTNTDLVNYLEKSWKLSDSDVEVVYDAVLEHSRTGRPVAIYASDSHIRDGLDHLIHANKALDGQIIYREMQPV